MLNVNRLLIYFSARFFLARGLLFMIDIRSDALAHWYFEYRMYWVFFSALCELHSALLVHTRPFMVKVVVLGIHVELFAAYLSVPCNLFASIAPPSSSVFPPLPSSFLFLNNWIIKLFVDTKILYRRIQVASRLISIFKMQEFSSFLS